MLVKKCVTAIKNFKIRAAAKQEDTRDANIAVAILNVGTFRAKDVHIMSKWHSISKLVGGTRALIAWIKRVPLDGPDADEERTHILRDIKAMNMQASINSGGQVLDFAEFIRFGNDGWLNDECLVAAAGRIAVEASWNPPPTVYVTNPTFAAFRDEEQRKRLIDRKDFIFSKFQEDSVIMCPIHINIDVSHWCGAIFDIKRRVVWIYDPFHREDYEDAAKTISLSAAT